jgi:hypothetical protein
MVGYVDYVPVYYEARSGVDAWDHTLGWWRKSDYYQHQWVLTSPMTHWRVPSFRDDVGVDAPNTHVFYDSGGFMLIAGHFPGHKLRINPVIGAPGVGDVGTAIEVTRWYDQTARKGDPCMILDAPVVSRKESAKGSAAFKVAFAGLERGGIEDVERALGKTIRNAEKMLEIRKGNYDLFAIAHGIDPRTLVRWFNRLHRVGEFDGWAFAPKGDIELLMTAMALIHANIPKKPIHLLGQAGMQAFATAAYLAAHIDSRITLDSSTAIRYAHEHAWLLPGSLRAVNITPSTPEAPWVWPDIPCQCPVCSMNGPQEYRSESADGAFYLVLHNLYQIIAYTKLVNAAKGRRDVLEQLAPKSAIAVFDAFDYYLENGWEAFIRRESLIGKKFDKSQSVLQDFDSNYLGLCDLCHSTDAEKRYQKLVVCLDCYTKLAARKEG